MHFYIFFDITIEFYLLFNIKNKKFIIFMIIYNLI